jgi:RNA polymerase sigma factor (sigma-70 family)
MTVRLILGDDHKMFRDGLRPLLARHKDLEVVGEASDGREVVELVESLRPDLVILDVTMPVLNGVEAARRIRQLDPGIRVAMLSMHSDRRFVLESLNAGASAYLLKDDAFEDLIRAIPRIMAGQVVLAERIGSLVAREYATLARREEDSAFACLSPREREVLQLIAEGRSTKEIAALHEVSVKTVETQRKQIMDKLDLHSVAELTKYAIREGLTSLD